MKKITIILVLAFAFGLISTSKAERTPPVTGNCTCDPPINPYLDCYFQAKRAKDQTLQDTGGNEDAAQVVYIVTLETCLFG